MVITKSYARIELTFSSSSKEQNKRFFKKLRNNKSEIEEIFGKELEWEELPENKMSRVKTEIYNVSLYNENDWEVINKFFIEQLPKFEKAFSSYIHTLR